MKLGNGSPIRGNLILMSKYGGPGLMYQLYQSVRYRHRFRTDTGINSGTNVHTGTPGTGILCRTELPEVYGTGVDVVPKLPKCPVPVLMYRTYRAAGYRYYRRYIPAVRTGVMPRYVPYRTHPWNVRRVETFITYPVFYFFGSRSSNFLFIESTI